MSPALEHVDEIPKFNNNWDLDNLVTNNLTAAVDQIHLCALRNDLNEGDEDGQPPTNHWTMCLQITPQANVMLDMAPGYGSDGLRGKIETASSADPYTKDTLKPFSFKPTKPITVGDAMQLIIENKRDAFNFSPEWEGCRYWMSVIMSDFENAGLVQEGSAAVAREALLMYWRNPEGSEARVMREGTFRNE
ncbi:hypothetical protein V493_08310 [Pseudogymnoascus sp. VKM F-4281 (FW-2241)]|nr:hypothetical protein V493_08310 [Pseudogymnoascus sp. VKM F-4281 (FW-2241)]